VNQGYVFGFVEYIALVVAKIIDIAAFGSVDIGNIIKIKSFAFQHCTVHICFAGRIDRSQNAPVFPQGIIDVAHQVIKVAILFIIKACPAFVGTKLLIGPSLQAGSAFFT
jgi:hypothetical protein